jgi:hypothetical protein
MTTPRIRLPLVRTALAVALAGLVAGGCGNVTVGGYTEVNVNVSGDAPAPAPTARAAVLDAPAASSPLRAEGEAEGEVEVDFQLFLISETGRSVQLGPGQDDIRVRIDIQGSTEAEPVKNQLIDAGRYTQLQIVFKKIQVEVSGGLVIDGQTVTGEVDVELSGTDLLVARPLDLVAVDGSTVNIVVDLNAQSWLAAVDPNTQPYTINEDVFAGLVDVVIQ